MTVPENEYAKLARRHFLARTRLRALWALKSRHPSELLKLHSDHLKELVPYYEELAYAQVKREDFPVKELGSVLLHGARMKAQRSAKSKALTDLKNQFSGEYALTLDTLRSVMR